jgi:hypothetical protein
METDMIFYTNRCKCGRALTKVEILERMQGPKGLCPCGSNEFHSTNFKWWEQLFLARSWRMWRMIRKGLLPPPPNKFEVAAARDGMINKIIEMEEEAEDIAAAHVEKVMHRELD